MEAWPAAEQWHNQSSILNVLFRHEGHAAPLTVVPLVLLF
jgi:hypothetical protein